MPISTPSRQEWMSALTKARTLPQLDHVELWLEYLPTENETLDIVHVLKGVDVIVHGPFIHCSLASHVDGITAASLGRFRDSLALSKALGARLVTFHAGTYPVFFNHAACIRTVSERFREFSVLTDPIVTLENMPVKHSGTAREALGHLSDLVFIASLLPNARFTLDIGHSIQNGDDYSAFLRAHAGLVSNIHLHDGQRGGGAHKRLGEGDLDVRGFVRLLAETQYSGYVSLETLHEDDTRDSWHTWLEAHVTNG